jgi:hypothetical protein
MKKFMIERKKPTLVETPLAPTPPTPTTPLKTSAPAWEGTLPGVEVVSLDGKGTMEIAPPVTMADLMMELSIIGEVFAKRKLFAVVSLRHQNGHFNLTCSWKDDTGESRAFVGRKISDSLTPKGLALVVGELKLAVGI